MLNLAASFKLRKFHFLLTVVRCPLGANEYRGGDGSLHVIKGKLGNPLFHTFLKATEQAGYPYTEDMNGYQQEGIGMCDLNIHKGILSRENGGRGDDGESWWS
jgi:choline dehydrogenase-like flavoprotein